VTTRHRLWPLSQPAGSTAKWLAAGAAGEAVVSDSADIDFHGDVPAAGAILGQADHHQAKRL